MAAPATIKGAVQQDLYPNSSNFYWCSLPIADNVLYEKFVNGLNARSKMGKPLAHIHELVGVNMKYEVSSGLMLAASVYGNPSDNLVILLHGGGQTRHAWGATGQKLSEVGFTQ